MTEEQAYYYFSFILYYHYWLKGIRLVTWAELGLKTDQDIMGVCSQLASKKLFEKSLK